MPSTVKHYNYVRDLPPLLREKVHRIDRIVSNNIDMLQSSYEEVPNMMFVASTPFSGQLHLGNGDRKFRGLWFSSIERLPAYPNLLFDYDTGHMYKGVAHYVQFVYDAESNVELHSQYNIIFGTGKDNKYIPLDKGNCKFPILKREVFYDLSFRINDLINKIRFEEKISRFFIEKPPIVDT